MQCADGAAVVVAERRQGAVIGYDWGLCSTAAVVRAEAALVRRRDANDEVPAEDAAAMLLLAELMHAFEALLTALHRRAIGVVGVSLRLRQRRAGRSHGHEAGGREPDERCAREGEDNASLGNQAERLGVEGSFPRSMTSRADLRHSCGEMDPRCQRGSIDLHMNTNGLGQFDPEPTRQFVPPFTPPDVRLEGLEHPVPCPLSPGEVLSALLPAGMKLAPLPSAVLLGSCAWVSTRLMPCTVFARQFVAPAPPEMDWFEQPVPCPLSPADVLSELTDWANVTFAPRARKMPDNAAMARLRNLVMMRSLSVSVPHSR